MVAIRHTPKKLQYFQKLEELVLQYPKILLVKVDHVGSKQMAEIRLALRQKAIILMGKNTMRRACLRKLITDNPTLKSLIGKIRENIGLIFCIEEPSEIRKIVLENKVPAPAKQGTIAPTNVMVYAGPTSLDPSQTSFFQALGISTKLVKGQIEIQTDVNLINVGEKVTASQSALLKKLNILPFNYGLVVTEVWEDGTVYDANVLDITNEDILSRVAAGIQYVTALSKETALPNESSIVHSVIEAFKNCASIGLETGVIFEEMSKIKEMLDNPDAFKSVAAAPTSTTTGQQAAAQKQEESEEDEEEDGDIGFSIFDD